MIRSEKFAAIREIADAIGTKSATVEQEKQLAQLLRGNIEAQSFFYDYMSMHVYLLSDTDHNFEFSYKRITETAVTEELVVRRKNNQPIANNLPMVNNTTQDLLASNEKQKTENVKKTPPPSNAKLWGIISTLLLLLLIIWQLFYQQSTSKIAEIAHGKIAIIGQGSIEGDHVFSGEYEIVQQSSLILADGDILHLAPHSKIKLFNNNEMRLIDGKLSIESTSHNNIIVHGPNFTLHSNGGELSLDLTHNHSNPIIDSGEYTLLIPSRWQPKHFWSFDSQSDRAIDSVGGATGIPAIGATRINGITGQGAFIFDNSADARIDVGSGGGTAPATGSFSVTDGVTIEALIRPEFSGKFKAIDVIFRKDRGDDELRMLLSFQHDQGKSYLRPKGDFNESLSFGLYIVGQGYHELKLPLDGREGRPTLAQLKEGDFHHIVASYHVITGLKTIYIDGELLASYQYPPGSKILTGGPGQASIGNNPAESRWAKEAFAGTIDEVAFYDFALSPLILKKHFNNAQQGNNYFGFPPSATPLPKDIQLALPAFTVVQLDPLTGLPYQVIEQ
ncbi:LamG domain-containing protein [Thalassotalea sp. PLHSN55]|uniref:LamG domain-containing protein n=1 Tax=Thalassotalea sp. PLHSN55 TaxID=3435888 RepID=UPI003F82DF51